MLYQHSHLVFKHFHARLGDSSDRSIPQMRWLGYQKLPWQRREPCRARYPAGGCWSSFFGGRQCRFWSSRPLRLWQCCRLPPPRCRRGDGRRLLLHGRVLNEVLARSPNRSWPERASTHAAPLWPQIQPTIFFSFLATRWRVLLAKQVLYPRPRPFLLWDLSKQTRSASKPIKKIILTLECHGRIF